MQCKKTGRKCPGPFSPFIFEAGTVAVQNGAVRLNQCIPPETKIRWKAIYRHHIQSENSDQTKRSKPGSGTISDVQTFSRASARSITPRLPLHIGANSTETLACRLGHALHTTKGTGYQFTALGEYLPYLPSRIGSNRALDAAAQHLLLLHQSFVSPQFANLSVQLQAYGRALRALKLELEDKQENASAETLSAALALCGVEVRVTL